VASSNDHDAARHLLQAPCLLLQLQLLQPRLTKSHRVHKHATRCMRLAACDSLHATRCMRLAACDSLHATRCMRLTASLSTRAAGSSMGDAAAAEDESPNLNTNKIITIQRERWLQRQRDTCC